MPISVKGDIKPLYKFGDSFSLKRDTKDFKYGSYLNFVRRAVADENFKQFQNDWSIGLEAGDPVSGTKRNVNRELAFRFNLRESDKDTFNQLWKMVDPAHKYAEDHKERGIKTDLENAYAMAADLAQNGSMSGKFPTWDRRLGRSDTNFVVFSDFHMTNFQSITLDNYFKDHNLSLYLDILHHYASTSDFVLVENGDVEECLIYEPTLNDAKARQKAFKKLPVVNGDADWDEFLDLRYAARRVLLDHVIASFPDYYRVIKDEFIARSKYVRLTGNHDTYLDEPRERDLKNRIEAHLGVSVFDILLVTRNDLPAYLVMHGHQFDTVGLQHGETAWAKSLGETYSETSSWLYQGPDRFWTESDTNRWINGESFSNYLAREVAGIFRNGSKGTGALITSDLKNIKADTADFVETLLGHEIAWDYFENEDPYDAFALEVLTGEEMFKFRHLNERALCSAYFNKLKALQGSRPIPKLVLGHTHEPRQNAVNPESGLEANWYLNSGSAGRFQNLIWCVEICGSQDFIVSWSRVNGKLKKITWRSEHTSQTIPKPMGETEAHFSKLVHDKVEWFSI
jgi:UDP-2,3-diacylglucosamine pyrophosphatase LpxH